MSELKLEQYGHRVAAITYTLLHYRPLFPFHTGVRGEDSPRNASGLIPIIAKDLPLPKILPSKSLFRSTPETLSLFEVFVVRSNPQPSLARVALGPPRAPAETRTAEAAWACLGATPGLVRERKIKHQELG